MLANHFCVDPTPHYDSQSLAIIFHKCPWITCTAPRTNVSRRHMSPCDWSAANYRSNLVPALMLEMATPPRGGILMANRQLTWQWGPHATLAGRPHMLTLAAMWAGTRTRGGRVRTLRLTNLLAELGK
ncbi:hypothetical protein Tco_0167659, partial [Tanacetum coccineum]